MEYIYLKYSLLKLQVVKGYKYKNKVRVVQIEMCPSV